MSKFIVFLDPGHGGIINGQYVTPGKRSPKFPDGSQLFEGVQNRVIVKIIHEKLLAAAIPEMDIYNVAPGEEDRPLENRTKFANDMWVQKGKPNSVYISVHADAAGDGSTWNPASGVSAYTSVGQNESDVFAGLLISELEKHLTNVKWRFDSSDGDKDKEEQFWVLRKTAMPSVLSENGFFTNEIECKRMLTPAWREQVADAHYQAILEFRKKQLGI